MGSGGRDDIVRRRYRVTLCAGGKRASGGDEHVQTLRGAGNRREAFKRGEGRLAVGRQPDGNRRVIRGRAWIYDHVGKAFAVTGGGNFESLSDIDFRMHFEKWRHAGQVRG